MELIVKGLTTQKTSDTTVTIYNTPDLVDSKPAKKNPWKKVKKTTHISIESIDLNEMKLKSVTQDSFWNPRHPFKIPNPFETASKSFLITNATIEREKATVLIDPGAEISLIYTDFIQAYRH